MSWSLIVHGGAKEIPPEQAEAHRAGCLAAIALGREVLEAGGSALDAVEASVRALEDDPTFNAGYGSVLTAERRVEMDAAVMDGATLDIGAVAAVEGVRHPVSVARAMLRERPVLVVGAGARRFAESRGMELCAPEEMIAPSRRAVGCDTVGAVALDTAGNIAAATSTGGLQDVLPGRVGDSPLPGCGYYADNATGGAALSGEGEDIARTLLAMRIVDDLTRFSPREAVTRRLPLLDRFGGDAGAIVIDRGGWIGWGHNSPQFAVALARAGEPSRAFLHQSEDGA